MTDRRQKPLAVMALVATLAATLAAAVTGLVRMGITIGGQQQTISDLVRRISALEEHEVYYHGAVHKGD